MAERDLELRIRALIEGSQDVQRLKSMLSDLERQKLGDNSKAFRSGLRDSTTATERLTAATRDLRRVLGGLGIAFSTAQIINMTRRSLELADQINITAERLGIGVEALQEWRFAAEEVGIQTNTLDNALQRFTRRTAEAAQGTGEAKGVVEELGLVLRDAQGNLRPAEEMLLDVADAMRRIPTHADRMRIAFKLFDTDGAIMLNLLSRGADGVRELTTEAREGGYVLGGEFVRGGAAANRELQKMGQLITLRFARTVAENAESITELARALARVAEWAAKAGAGFAEFSKFVGIGFAELIHGPTGGVTAALDKQIDDLEARLADIDKELKVPRALRYNVFSSTDLFASTEDLEAERRAVMARLELLRVAREQARRIQGQDPPPPPPALGVDPVSAYDANNPYQPPPQPEGEDNTKQIDAIIAKLQEQADTYGMTAEQVALYRLEQLGASEDKLELARSIAATTQALRDEEQAAKDAAEAEERRRQNRQADADLLAQMEQEVMLAGLKGEAYHEAARAIAQETAVSKLSADATEQQREAIRRLAGELYDLTEVAKDAGDEMSAFAEQAAKNIQDAFADFLFDPFQNGLRGMAQGFVDAIRRMAAELLAQQLLKSFFESASGMGGGLGQLFGTFAASLKHTGGVVGEGGQVRSVSPLLFAGAQRYHTGGLAGLAPNEVPIIAKRREEVLTLDDPRHRDNGGMSQGNVRIVNVLDPSVMQDYLTSSEGERVILNTLERNGLR